jgi:hypothetical protein
MTWLSTKADSVRVVFSDCVCRKGVGSRTTAFPLMTVTGEQSGKNLSFSERRRVEQPISRVELEADLEDRNLYYGGVDDGTEQPAAPNAGSGKISTLHWFRIRQRLQERLR